MSEKAAVRTVGSKLGLLLIVLEGCAAFSPGDPKDRQTLRAPSGVITCHFDAESLESVPTGWRMAETNPTESLATWRIVEDPTAPSGRKVMALTSSKNYDGTYNLAIIEGSSFQDLDLRVHVKAVAGEEDQGGGPIWRCQDEDNYYVCRFNPLEHNYRVYVVRNGRRRQLQSVHFDSEPGRWYTVRVTAIGDRITCYLDDQVLLEAEDRTFADPGMVGLWTKADAVTSFDNLAVRPFYRD